MIHKMKHYPSYADWKADQSTRNQSLIIKLQEIIESAEPQLVAGVKWGQGVWFDGQAAKVFIHAEEDHVQLGFYNGSSLSDPHGLLSGNGKFVRFVRIFDTSDIDKNGLTSLIHETCR